MGQGFKVVAVTKNRRVEDRRRKQREALGWKLP